MNDDPQQSVNLDEWDEIVRQKYKIPKGFWSALKTQESGDNPDAVSPTGVRGRFQVTKKTAASYGLDRDDPFQQTVAAARHIDALRTKLKSQFGDDPRKLYLGVRAEYYNGDNAVDDAGTLSGKSVDGVSNPTRDAERFAKTWGAWREANGDDLAEFGESAPKPQPKPQPNRPPAQTLLRQPVTANPFDLRKPVTPTDPNSDWQRAERAAPPSPNFERRKGAVDEYRKQASSKSVLGRLLDRATVQLQSKLPNQSPQERERLEVARVAEGLDNEPVPTGIEHYFNTARQAAIKGTAQIPEGLAELSELVNSVPDAVARKILAQVGVNVPPGKRAAEMLRPVSDYGGAVAETLYPNDPTRQDFATKLASGAGSTIPFLASGLVTGGSSFGPAIAGAAMNAQQIGREYDQAGARATGDRDASIAVAAVTGLTEAAGLGGLLKRWGLDRSLKQRAVEILKEGGQEALQQWLNNLNAKFVGAYDPNRPQSKGVAENFAIWAILSAVGEGAGGMAESVRNAQGAAAVRQEPQAPMNMQQPGAMLPTQVVPQSQLELALKRVQEQQAGLPPAPAAQPEAQPQAADDPLLAAFGIKSKSQPGADGIRLFSPDEEPAAPGKNQRLDSIEIDGQDIFFHAPKNVSSAAARKLAERQYRASQPEAEKTARSTAPLGQQMTAPLNKAAAQQQERERRRGEAEQYALDAAEQRAQMVQRGDFQGAVNKLAAEIAAMRERQRVAASPGEKAQIAESINAALAQKKDYERQASQAARASKVRSVVRDPFAQQAVSPDAPTTAKPSPRSARSQNLEDAHNEVARALSQAESLEEAGDLRGAAEAYRLYQKANSFAQSLLKGGRVGDVQRRMDLAREAQEVKRRIDALGVQLEEEARSGRRVQREQQRQANAPTRELSKPLPPVVPFTRSGQLDYQALADREGERDANTEELQGNLNLHQFVRKQGGVRPSVANRGELSYLQGKEGGPVGLVRAKGVPADVLREYANEAGYGPYETEDDFLQALQNGREVFSTARRNTDRLAAEEEAYYRQLEEAGEAEAQSAEQTETPQSPYARMVAANREAINQLYDLDLNSDEAQGLLEGVREWAVREGVEKRHVGALIDTIRNYQADRAVSGDLKDAAARRKSQTGPQWKRTRMGNSEPLGGTGETARFKPDFDDVSRTTESGQMSSGGLGEIPSDYTDRLTAEQLRDLFESYTPRQLEDEIVRLETRRNDDIRQGNLTDDERAQLALELKAANARRHALVKQKALPVKVESRGGSAEKRVLSAAEIERWHNAVPASQPPSRQKPQTPARPQRPNVRPADVPAKPRTVTHDDPAINGKPVIAETQDGRVIVENSDNQLGVSVVKDQTEQRGMGEYPPAGDLIGREIEYRGRRERVLAYRPQPNGERWIETAELDKKGNPTSSHHVWPPQNFTKVLEQNAVLEKPEPSDVKPASVRQEAVKKSAKSEQSQANLFDKPKADTKQSTAPEATKPDAQAVRADADTLVRVLNDAGGEMSKRQAVREAMLVNSRSTPAIELLKGEGKLAEDGGTLRLVNKPHNMQAENSMEQPANAPVQSPATVDLAHEIASRLASKEAWQGNKNAGLRALAKQITDKRGEDTLADREIYEAMEAGVNEYIARNKSLTLDLDAEGLAHQLERVRTTVTTLLPTQTVRDGRQVSFQQFSTPPDEAMLVGWVANIKDGEEVTEPSAGTGSLATWAKVAGAKVTANEIDPKRRELLKAQGFDKITDADANYIHYPQILPESYRPTVVLMNPPFSREGNKGAARDLTVGGDHILAALERLADGGRLVAIVGEGMQSHAQRYAPFFRELANRGASLRANIGIDEKVYAPYGTTFGTRILVIDKTPKLAEQTAVVYGDNQTLAQAAQLLEGVRNDRRILKPAQASADATVHIKHGAPDAAQQTSSRSEQGAPDRGRTPAAGQSARLGGAESKPADTATTKRQPAADVDASGAETGPGTAQPGLPVADTGSQPSRSDADGERSATARPAGEGARSAERGAPKAAGPVSELRRRDTGQLDAQVIEEEPEDELPAALSYNTATRIENAQPHAAPLIESAALASVKLPKSTYVPHLPERLIKMGHLSDAQLESIIYAGTAHSQFLKSGERKGFFVGDGTGLGKGRTVAGIILDNFQQGRRKAVWISKNNTLLQPAQRDWQDLGRDPKDIRMQSDFPASENIKMRDGILFTTFGTLQSSARTGEAAAAKTRVQQIIDWVGKDFDGVIAIDESHHLQNELAQKGKRGVKEASKTALAGKLLRESLPQARVVYLSATGATEPANLAYLDRLGLWGKGTPFNNAMDFVDRIKSAGLSAMEMVAQNLKQMGLYVARSISFEGVTQDTLVHNLTEDQRETYDTLSRAWQKVYRGIDAALSKEMTNASAQAKSFAKSQFWSQQQRFFNQMIVTMQMPSVVKAIRKDLADGKSVVLQVVSTFEAQLMDSLDAQKIVTTNKEQEIDEIDLTPREGLKAWLRNAFPVGQYESVKDPETGAVTNRPVMGPDGKQLENPAAVKMRDGLIRELDDLRMPPDPILFLYKQFGAENVAEITGRSVMVYENKEGNQVVIRRPESARKKDITEFQAGQKRILIFSKAGGTGASYHADRRAQNQQKRVHYLVEAGWTAADAVQGLGRTHRSNQAQPPHYVLVTTDVKGQKRFISSIARRLEQLGALTRGQRQGGNQSLFSAMDNLEGQYARMALRNLLTDIRHGRIEGMSKAEFEAQTGLELEDEKGQPKDIEVTQFLNRLLSIELEPQNLIFDKFEENMLNLISTAQELGTFDNGLEQIRGENPRIKEEKEIWRDPETGYSANYVEVAVDRAIERDSFERVQLKAPERWLRNRKSGKVWAQFRPQDATDSEGSTKKIILLQSAGGKQTIKAEEFKANDYEVLSQGEAKQLYEEQLTALPTKQEFKHALLTGTLLPVWDRLPKENMKAKRVVVGNRRILGLELPSKDIEKTLRNFGQAEAGATDTQMNAEEMFERVMNKGVRIRLGNGITIAKRSQYGQDYVEFKDWTNARQLINAGAREVMMGAQRRLYAPDAKTLAQVLDAMGNPAVADVQTGGSGGSNYAAAGLGALQARFDRVPPKFDFDKYATDIAKRMKREKRSDADKLQALQLLRNLETAQRNNDGASFQDTRAQLRTLIEGNIFKRAGKTGGEILNFARSLMLTGDLPHLRQGLFLTIPPRYWKQAMTDTVAALGNLSDKQFNAFQDQVKNSTAAKLGKKAGLYLAAHGISEENFASKWAHQFPVTRKIEQVYASYMDMRRLDAFERAARRLQRNTDLTPARRQAALKDVARAINILSGRGAVGDTVEKAIPLLNKVLLAPRYTISRMQVPSLIQPHKPGYRDAVYDLASTSALLLSLGGLAVAAGVASTSLDYDDPDFLKLRVGNKVYDLSAGLAPVAKIGAQVAEWAWSQLPGEKRAEKKRVSEETKDDLLRFTRGKLSPAASLAADALSDWTNMAGEKVTLTKAVTDRVLPLVLRDTYKAWEEEGIGGAAAVFLPAELGAGTSVYPQSPLRQSPLAGDLRRFDLPRGNLYQKPGEPKEVFKERQQAYQGLSREFAAKLSAAAFYNSASDEEKKDMLNLFGRRLKDASNEVRPDRAKLEPGRIYQDVKKAEIERRRKAARESGRLRYQPSQ